MGKPARPVCPECISGKHGNCNTTALDPKTDAIVRCFCDVQDHDMSV